MPSGKMWETMKFSFHHRAFYCYLVMSLWIIFLVTAMYKYMGVGDEPPAAKKATRSASRVDLKLSRIIATHCRPANEIKEGSEGSPSPKTWQLEGVLVVTRHGDRGPLAHLRGGDTLPCDTVPYSSLLQSYTEYVRNATVGGRATWVQAPGPFHNFPTLPVQTSATSCALGQLTLYGVQQMLTIGAILKRAYADRLGWTDSDDLKQGEVLAYSTRYRRTFQSALALLFALLPRAAFPARASALRESHSVAFCFRDCACPHADRLARRLSSEARKRLKSHPAIVELVEKMSKVVLESPERVDPDVLRDALLAILCHAAPLPCSRPPAERGRAARSLTMEREAQKQLEFDAQMEREKLSYYRQWFMDTEPDYDLHVELDRQPEYAEVPTEKTSRECVRWEQVFSVFSYTEWSRAQAAKSGAYKKKGTLDAYGLIRHMVKKMMSLVSSGRPRLVLYSGHDRTLRSLAAAMGIDEGDVDGHYAERMLIEVYRRRGSSPERLAGDFYVRTLVDGADVTDRAAFCRGWHNAADGDARLCPLENLVRFVHDDYFQQLNATNYKDACALH